MWEEDFYEPSEFDEKVEEWKEMLRDSVKKEYRDEMERLRKENAELLEIKRNWKEKTEELKRAKDKAELDAKIAIENAEVNAKRARLYDLLKPFMSTVYAVQYEYRYIHKKCNKCDEKGYIHFKSPSGKDCTEQCKCRKKKCFYFPIEIESFRLSQFIDRREEVKSCNCIFTYKRDRWPDGDENDDFCSTSNIYHDGLKFSDIEYWNGIIFENKEDAQAYCDYLNK